MGRLFSTVTLILAASVCVGCYPCVQSSYYDPCAGVVYGPSVNPPTFLSGLKKNKHEKHSCPLCSSESSASTFAGAEQNYGAVFSQPSSVTHTHSGNCQCQSGRKSGHSSSHGKRSCSCRGNSRTGCQCAMPMADCHVCEACPVSHCETCPPLGDGWSTMGGDSYPVLGESYPGVVYDESFSGETFPLESYSSEPMILPGETVLPGDTVLSDGFSGSGDCPHCQSTHGQSMQGPIFDGTIVPDYESDGAGEPTLAPAAEPEPESTPGETVTPEPDPLPPTTSMVIPTFPAPRPARQVHWVPNTLK